MTTLIRPKEVAARVGLHRVHIMRLADQGRFPKPVVLGQNSLAFVEAEVSDWIEARIVARDEGTDTRPPGPKRSS